MTMVAAADRSELDSYILALAQAAGDLTIEEFREAAVQRADRARRRTQWLLSWLGVGFILAVVMLFAFPDLLGKNRFRWVLVWALSLGGLGGVAHVLLHVLGLAQEQVHQKPEEIAVFGRIFLGCLFSIVLTLAAFASQIWMFADDVMAARAPAANGRAVAPLLFPFLCGYSIPLVLGLLDKFIQAVSLTLAINELTPKRRARARRPAAPAP